MRNFWIIAVVAACAVSSAQCSPLDNLMASLSQKSSLLENNQKLIQELVANLQNAAQDASEAIQKFGAGLQEQTEEFRDKLLSDIGKLRESIEKAVQELNDKFQASGVGINTCVEAHRTEAEKVFKETVSKTMSCADDQISGISERVTELGNMTSSAVEYADSVLGQMRDCTDEHGDNVWAAGTCMGGIVLRTQLKGATFAVHSGIQIGRINLAIATLPATLQSCASSRVVEAGVAVAKIVLDIDACSTSNIYDIFTGNGNAAVSA